jgi:topoisomerase-4 subunit A
LIATQDATLRAVTPEMSLHFDAKVIHLERWIPKKPITAIYYDPEKQRYFLKRFCLEIADKEDYFIKDHGKLIYLSFEWRPVLTLIFEKPRGKEQPPNLEINAEEFISIKGFKALGNQLTNKKIKTVELKETLPYDEPKELNLEDIEVKDEEFLSSDSDSQISLDL